MERRRKEALLYIGDMAEQLSAMAKSYHFAMLGMMLDAASKLVRLILKGDGTHEDGLRH